MLILDKHIFFIGFKHVGKSTIAKNLARRLQIKFIDLDDLIEILFEKKFSKKISCRLIMEQYGEIFFRNLETETLRYVVSLPFCIVALGGGTILSKENQNLIKLHFNIHLKVAAGIVFERILMNGMPSFFTTNENTIIQFERIWEEREKIYKALASLVVENSSATEKVVAEIVDKLNAAFLMKKILLIHGPNLNLLGNRDHLHYGNLSLCEVEEITRMEALRYGIAIIAYQSNCEGKIIDKIQLEFANCMGIIINPGALCHYSYALHDALLDTKLPVVEVHLSNLKEREDWRRKSVIEAACIRSVSGKKEQGYKESVKILVEYFENNR